MSQIELLLPKMGESVAEATIIKWVKKEGEAVKADEPIIEIATDKVDSEVPSPEDGVLLKCLVKEGDVVQVGQPIALIGTGAGASAAPVAAAPAAPAPVAKEETHVAAAAMATPIAEEVLKNGPSGKFYSPLVRNIAKAEGVSMTELETINGSGQGGRVTKDDVLDFIAKRGSGSVAAPVAVAPVATAPIAAAPAAVVPSAPKPASKPAVFIGANDEIVEMDRMRKLIADHMVMSKQTSPHVTSYVEADVTNIVMWREKVKKSFEQKHKTKLTFTPLFIEAVAKAIKDFPGINISVDGTNLIYRRDINIGMATALPSGNLIVPVIKNADQLNLVGLASKVNDLADRARNNKLSPDDIQGGTYTLTNVGTFGNVMGTPIINQPQVAIMAVGAIRKRPAVIETPFGDTLGIRHMMFLSHSYDHRVVDGALGGSFVRRVADYLEAFDVDREF
ncbi:MAG: dihydrolipoamide acetyltransferase family protein [Flavobacteriales bacterium]|jgi:2-oxoglutarate dehydrogenase E2 component (dihydrolipoamide succinyltransferase)